MNENAQRVAHAAGARKGMQWQSIGLLRAPSLGRKGSWRAATKLAQHSSGEVPAPARGIPAKGLGRKGSKHSWELPVEAGILNIDVCLSEASGPM